MTEQGEIKQNITEAEYAATSATGDAVINITNYYYREEARLAPTESGDVVEEALPCPYRGLFHFGPNDAKFFFGREIFIAELYRATKTRNFIPVLGASGSGKSSVVLAGLVPKLQQEGHWQFTHFRPGSDPFQALSLALVPLYATNLNETERIAQARQLANYLRNGDIYLADVFAQIQQNYPHDRILLIADQFEELYTLCHDKDIRREFLDCLLASLVKTASLSSSAAVLVLTMRADFLGNALSYRPFADILQNNDQKLGPMNQEELEEAIVKPAELLGVRLEPGLSERILEAVEDEPGSLPLLEFALTLLWDKQQNGQLTHEAYEEIGGVKQALAEYAQDKYESLSEEEKKKAQRIFIQLVRPGEGTEDTRRLATRDEMGEDNWDLVTRLASARLVVTNQTKKTAEKEEIDQETVEIIHEALIQEWGSLRDWMEINRDFRTWQDRLKVRMQEWETSGRDNGALLQGVPLGEAEVWWQQRREELSDRQEAFINSSIDLRDRLQAEEKQRQQQKLKQARKLVIMQTGLIVAILIGGGFFWWQQQDYQNSLEAVFLDTNDEQILDALPIFMGKADKLKEKILLAGKQSNEEDVDKSLGFYRQLLRITNQFRRDFKREPENVGEAVKNNIEQIKAMSFKAEKSLGEIINTQRIPELSSKLEECKNIPLVTDLPENAIAGNECYEKALNISHEIIATNKGAGADLDGNSLVDTPPDAEQIPCNTLRKIQEVWLEYTNKHCGWYGQGEYYQYESPNCQELNGYTLTSGVFNYFPLNFALKRLDICKIPQTIDLSSG